MTVGLDGREGVLLGKLNFVECNPEYNYIRNMQNGMVQWIHHATLDRRFRVRSPPTTTLNCCVTGIHLKLEVF